MRQPGELRTAVAELHRQLLMALTAADFRLGKAYGLGRALAQTALLPDARHPETFRGTFARFRLDNLLGWLADLRSAFPPHAAKAVSGSLQAWAAWTCCPPTTTCGRPTSSLAISAGSPCASCAASGSPPPPWRRS